jgi:hypothetical protein
VKATYLGLKSPDGNEFTNISDLSKFCKNHNLNYSNVCQIMIGKRKSHLGWTRIGEPVCRFKLKSKE